MQLDLFEKVKKFLEEGNLAISYDYSEEELELMKDSHLLTYKPFVYAANVNEENMDISEEELRKILNIQDKNIKVVAVCAKLEEDMVEMSQEEKNDFLTDM
jgi:ribosome-binding ATPase YchF (GTP1/OBG family)